MNYKPHTHFDYNQVIRKMYGTFPMSPNIMTRCNDSSPGWGDDLNE